MKEEKSKIYFAPVKKKLEKEKLIYSTLYNNDEDSRSTNTIWINVREKLSKIFRDNIEKRVVVKLITNNGELDTVIVGLTKNSVLTEDNKYIEIRNIRDVIV